MDNVAGDRVSNAAETTHDSGTSALCSESIDSITGLWILYTGLNIPFAKIIPTAMLLLLTSRAHSSLEAYEALVADVTSTACSLIWISQAPIPADATITVEIFDDFDSDGIADSTDPSEAASWSLASSIAALDNGIVKIEIAGLEGGSTYAIRATVASSDGEHTITGANGSSIGVTTAVATAAYDDSGAPFVNDLVVKGKLDLDGSTPVPGSLLILLSAPDVAAYPLSAFIGDGVDAPDAVFNLSNLISVRTDRNFHVQAGTTIQFSALRGLQCQSPEQQATDHVRRVSAHQELPIVATVEVPEICHLTDLNCDDIVDIADAQKIFDAFLATRGTCAYNEDLDLNQDDVIDIVDGQRVFDEFLETAPF